MSDEQNPINGEMPKAKRRRPRLPKVAISRPSLSVPRPSLPRPRVPERLVALRRKSTPDPVEEGPRVELLPEDERGDSKAGSRRRARVPHPHLPAPVERAAFTLQEKVVWPVEDRLGIQVPSVDRRIVAGGGAAVLAAGAAALVIALSSGGSPTDSTPTAPVASAPTPPLASVPAAPQPKEAKPAGPTLHGAAPVFTPAPKDETEGKRDGRERLSASEEVASEGTDESTASSAHTATEEATAGTTDLSSPATDRISSDPKNSKPASTPTSDARIASAPAVTPDGPPAGPKALKVAKRFAQGFVVYETGGEETEFKDDFDAAATPQLTEALLQRPPHQPSGVKVPRAKVVNVVAGPSQGTVYRVSVSLLRVGVTSELRLDMEMVKHQWRVTNVLG